MKQPNYFGAVLTGVAIVAVVEAAIMREKSLVLLFFRQLGLDFS